MRPRDLSALLAGALFGFGLSLSRMVDPKVVVSFLDLAGSWDPRLLFVMGGALAVALPSFRWVLGRLERPACEARFELPTRQTLDRPLLVGAALFGVGWGLGGVCPGPAVTSLAYGRAEGLLFVGCMLAGMQLYAWWERRSSAPPP